MVMDAMDGELAVVNQTDFLRLIICDSAADDGCQRNRGTSCELGRAPSLLGARPIGTCFCRNVSSLSHATADHVLDIRMQWRWDLRDILRGKGHMNELLDTLYTRRTDRMVIQPEMTPQPMPFFR